MIETDLPPRRFAGAPVAVVALATAVAAVNFLLQLGSSSYFIDEVLSVEHSTGSWHSVLRAVSHNELTPWPYFLFLHAWLSATGTQAEWVLRLPSALAGLALIPATYWAARQFVTQRGALLACGLAALSPLLLQYAQQARVYTLVTLTTTLAVAATVSGVRRSCQAGRGGALLFWSGALLGVIGLWLDYVAAFIVAVLCLWVLGAAGVPGRRRAGYLAICAVGAVVLVPLFAYQSAHNPPGVFPGSWGSRAVHLLAGPFDARSAPVGVGVVDAVGAVVVIVAILWVACRGRPGVGAPALLVALAAAAPLCLLLGAIVDHHVLVSRYAIVAAPFSLIAVAGAASALLADRGRRAGQVSGAALMIATLGASLAGLIASHQASGFYPPTRPTVAYVEAHRAPGDAVLLATGDPVLGYYVTRLLPGVTPVSVAEEPAALTGAVAARRRIWLLLVDGGHPSVAALVRAGDYVMGSRLHYRVLAVHAVAGSGTGVAYLLGPAA